ncbi:MAG: NADH-quinone oxidoreductase subunit NuoF [Synergistaceae bacterium]|jgi:NADH-quinone oxidoreductase subunit F/NADP-reducing hydrogenase subunit HndC|nr:NADH-quinone oxidoreductase subunit NuoF [Synergistaceae bacterium]
MEKLARAHVLCCGGTGCSSSGSKEIIPALKEKLAARGMSDEVKVVETGCHGLCELGPLVIVYPEGVFYTKVKVSDVDEIVETHLMKGRVIERLLFREPATLASVPDYDDIAFYKKQHRYALVNCGHINPESMEEYIGAEGYEGLAKVLSMKPEDVIGEIKKSGLRGRGGGGFPTGNKWQFTRNAPGDKKYVVCNADEGDPGAFMDRSVLEGDPHRVLEGMIICGYAVGADEGYIYCRAEYPLAIKRLQGAIKQATDAGLLGEDILGSGFNFTIHIKEGAGAFVCGEETALIASIEGRRGMPRPRPPFPAVSGLWGKPTNINNVETFANIPSIMRDGGDYFASQGTETSKGTKVFALTGKINNTGLAEVPMGITMREIIYDIGGGIPNGKKFKAVQIGGPSGGCLPEQLLDLAIDYESLTKAGAMMGSGGLVVMDETTCMVDVARYFLNFTQDESCGKCTPCREGTKRMLEILNRICDGKGTEEDIPLLESLAKSIKAGSLCALGQTAPNPVLSTLNFFRHEYEAHIRDHKCPAGVCTAFVGYTITDNCRGCGLCKKACPAEAISGEVKSKHVIDPEKCVKCGACQAKCPFKAIDKG